jgi:hypothetical protein
LEAWLWTGPLAHLLGGSLDLAGALLRYGAGVASRRAHARVRATHARIARPSRPRA